MSATTREESITYNGYTVGGSSTSRIITGFIMSMKDQVKGKVQFTLVIVGTPNGTLITECAAAEAAFSTPYRNLSVSIDGTVLNVSQSGNTSLDAIPSIDAPGQPGDSAGSRIYRVSIEFGVPATWNTQFPGLRHANYELSFSPSRRRMLRLSGQMTAVPGTNAFENYTAQIATLSAQILTLVGITNSEVFEEPVNNISVNNKTCDFVRVYQELIFAQPGGYTDTKVVGQQFTISYKNLGSENSPVGGKPASPPVGPITPSPGNPGSPGSLGSPGTPGVTAVSLREVTATYTCWIDKTVTTDLASEWVIIRDFARAKLVAALNGSPFAMMSEGPAYDYDDNKISSVITGFARDENGSDVIQYVEDTIYDTQASNTFIPAWDGDPTACFIFKGVEIPLRTTTTRKRSFGSNHQTSKPSSQDGNWYLLSHQDGSRVLKLGHAPFSFNVVEEWTKTVHRNAKSIGNTRTGGAASGVTPITGSPSTPQVGPK